MTLAGDGATALRAAADRHPDVVVLDLGVPDLDGAEVIAGIRGWSPVPIIVLSARTDSGEERGRARRGRGRLRQQIFGMDELLARLRAAVRRAGAAARTGEPVLRLGELTVDRGCGLSSPAVLRPLLTGRRRRGRSRL